MLVAEEEWERRSLLRKRGMNLRWLLEKVAGHFGVDTECLESGSKVPTIAKARAVLCYLGVRKIGLTSVSIATELGISQSAVSRAISPCARGIAARGDQWRMARISINQERPPLPIMRPLISPRVPQ